LGEQPLTDVLAIGAAHAGSGAHFFLGA
jgi:hypothetical protein